MSNDPDNKMPRLRQWPGDDVAEATPPKPPRGGTAGTAASQPRATTKRVIKERFILEEQIGAGGMGSVYKARDLRKVEARDRNPWVAIKLLNQTVNQHPQAFIALQREARKAQTLAHPNIVPVYDFDRAGDTFFMTMELQTGASLDQVIRRHPQGLPYEKASRIIRDAGTALQYAHEHNIVHADFKPGNIFLTDTGKTKVFDFGIARVVSSIAAGSEDEKTLFNPGEVGGLTPAYASFEMLSGEDPVAGDDVFALACIAYELLSGRHPYRRIPVTKAWKKLVWPRRIWSIKRRQWLVLRKALSRRRRHRYASVDAFLRDFFAAAEPEPGARHEWVLALALAGLGTGMMINAADKQQQAEQLLAAVGLREAVDAERRQMQGEVELLKQQTRTHFSDFADTEDWHRQMLSHLRQLEGQLVDASWLELYKAQAAATGALDLQRERRDYQQTQHRLRHWLLLFEAAVEARFMVLTRTYLQQGETLAAARSLAFALDYGSDPTTALQRVAELRAVTASPEAAAALNPDLPRSNVQNPGSQVPELQRILDEIAQRLDSAARAAGVDDPCTQPTAQQVGCADVFLDGSGRTGPKLVVLPPDPGSARRAIGRFEVSVDEFVQYCRDTGRCDGTAAGTHPVSDISVEQARGYLAWLSAKTGFDYRLPTLLQWRNAAAAVTSTQDANCSVSIPWVVTGDGLWPVDSGAANHLGLKQMVGNVREMVRVGHDTWVAGGSRRDTLAECSVDAVAPAPATGDPVTGFRVIRSLRPRAVGQSVVRM